MKAYIKPMIKKFRKGQLSENGRPRWHRVGPTYEKYGIEPNKKLLKYLQTHEHEKFTFDSPYTIGQLTNLRDSLIIGKFIGKDITQTEFTYIFKKQMLTWIKPIVWLDSKENLRFFLENLIPGIILHKKQVAVCFIDASRKPIQISKPNRTKGVMARSFKLKGRKKDLQEIIFKI